MKIGNAKTLDNQLYATTNYVASYVDSTISDNMPDMTSYVAKTTTINGKNLSANVTLTAGDVKMSTANDAVTIASKISTIETSVSSKGDMTIASFVNGEGVVKSATNATSAVSAGNVPWSGVSGAPAVETHIASSAIHVPSVAGMDNGKVLKIVGGTPSWGDDLTADGSAVLPNYDDNNIGQVLQVTSTAQGIKTAWATAATGNMNTTDYVTAGGTGVVLSAGNATTVNGHTVSTNVPANAVFTDTVMKVSGSTISSMVAGTNVTLTMNGGVVTIAATGGGNVTVDGTVTQNGTNAVAGSAVYNYVSAQIGNIASALSNI